MLNTLDKFKNLKDSEELLLGYQGTITESLTDNLLTIAENKLAMVEYNTQIKKKVFNILVEVLQNVYHNQEEISSSPAFYHEIMLMLVKGSGFYHIISGNYINQG